VIRESYRPEVTLVILTADPVIEIPGRGRLAVLPNLLTGLLERSTYPAFRVLVVDDGRLSRASLQAMRDSRVRSVSFSAPSGTFNYAAKANFALGLVRTREFVLLNDDLEVGNPDWLEALVDCLAVPDVGVVGAHLVFPDGRTQHAGVRAAGADGPTHRLYGCAATIADDFGPADAVRDVSAITGAVLASRRDIVAAAGGFDERFARNYNDVDFCLRVRERGYRVVYTPHAKLVHFEHGTFGARRADRQELRAFRSRWRRWCADDPFFPAPTGRPMAYHRPGGPAKDARVASAFEGATE
jgi:GT2 family glycosyltransferase